MKPNIYDYILSMFKSNDSLRPALNEPFPQEDSVIATDSHSMIVVDKNLLACTYEGHEKAPNALGIFKDFQPDTEVVLNRDNLLSDFFKIEMEWYGKKVDCDVCEGSGSKECKCCGNESDCDDCDGTGSSFEEVPFTKPYLNGETIGLCATHFSSNYINKLFQVAFFLEEKEITASFVKGFPLKNVTFKIGKVDILLMPMIPSRTT